MPLKLCRQWSTWRTRPASSGSRQSATPSTRPSAHVLEKCGFTREEVRREHFVFPNLKPQKKSDVFSYVRFF